MCEIVGLALKRGESDWSVKLKRTWLYVYLYLPVPVPGQLYLASCQAVLHKLRTRLVFSRHCYVPYRRNQGYPAGQGIYRPLTNRLRTVPSVFKAQISQFVPDSSVIICSVPSSHISASPDQGPIIPQTTHQNSPSLATRTLSRSLSRSLRLSHSQLRSLHGPFHSPRPQGFRSLKTDATGQVRYWSGKGDTLSVVAERAKLYIEGYATLSSWPQGSVARKPTK